MQELIEVGYQAFVSVFDMRSVTHTTSKSPTPDRNRQSGQQLHRQPTQCGESEAIVDSTTMRLP